ncbi:tyrosine-type recombinase/integrase [Paraburkholderia aspalathi]|uniref:Site-specific recombinase XerD n=1 Tax=Paraburkholderia aspalathi TaxID=1324617 RepID=A0A1I6Y3J1_9BURK|nr:integrase family protein [Paraburkholderia aspalathi]SFT45149.1 Site-specific recombinase XerD [Paraburkholderia aspalathi]
MNKTNFTADRVASFQCESEKKQSIYWDAKTPGFGLRVTAAGARAYVYESRLFGKTVRLTIGDARAWTLGKARTEAARLKTVIDDGKDPREVKAGERAAHEARKAEARRKDVTLGDAWLVYLEERRPRWSELHYRDHVDLSSVGGQPKKRGKGLTEPGPLAPLMPLKPSDLSADRISAWLKAEAAKRPARARLAFNLLRIFAGWCESKPEYRGLVDAQAVSTRIAKDTLPKRHAKADVLQREQLAAWFKAVWQIENPAMTTYLIALLITGARREEMAALKWDDVDFKWRSLSIADKVEDTGRMIPLTPFLASLLAELKRLNDTPPNIRQLRRLQQRGEYWRPSPWVFSSKTSADGRLAAPNRALHRVCQLVGIPPVTPHGLRRSFGTLAEWVEVPVGIVAQIMGHAPSALAEKHYRRRPLDLLRMWHDRIEAWLLEQAGIEFDASAAQAGLHAVK